MQDCHSKAEPEVLLLQHPGAIEVPAVLIGVVAIPQHNKYPSYKARSDYPDHLTGVRNALQARPILQSKQKGKSPANVSGDIWNISPSNESMVPFKNTNSNRVNYTDVFLWFYRMDPLMVHVPDPGQRAQDRDGDRKVCKYTHGQHGVMIGAVVNKDQDHFEYQPHEA